MDQSTHVLRFVDSPIREFCFLSYYEGTITEFCRPRKGFCCRPKLDGPINTWDLLAPKREFYFHLYYEGLIFIYGICCPRKGFCCLYKLEESINTCTEYWCPKGKSVFFYTNLLNFVVCKRDSIVFTSLRDQSTHVLRCVATQ